MKHGRKLAAATTGLILAGSAAMTGTPASAATNMKGGPLPAGTTAINILNLNDFHGRIDTDGKGTLGKNFACTILTQREQLGAANTLTLGAGDLIGASPFTSAVQDDAPTIDYLNALGMNASSVGNHEFDAGYDDLTQRVEPRADYEYLGANVLIKGTQTPALKTHEIYDVAGVRVGVIGAVTKDTPSLVAGTGVANLDFIDPVDGVNRVANELTDGNEANGEADVLIAEYHEGGPYSSTTGTLADQLAVPVFAHLVNDTSAKVAAILQGHTHQAYVYDVQIPGEAAGSTRPVLQTGNYAAAVGKVQLGYDPATKKVTGYNAANVPAVAPSPACLTNATYQSAAKVIDDAIAFAAPIAAQPVGKITADILRDGADDRKRESALSNLVAQQYVDVVNAPGRDMGADIGVMNPGGVRADLLYGTDGTVTFAQAATVLPFGNTVKTADYTGAQFKQILEEQWQPAGVSRPFLAMGLSKNVTYTYDPTRAQGSRITGIFVGGAPIDPAKVYTIASASFLITNTGVAPDNFGTFLKGTNYRDSGLVDQNAFVDWFKANSPVTPSPVQHGVAILNAPTAINYGKTTTFRVEGVDLSSNGKVKNTSVLVSIDGRTATTAKVSSVRVEGVPSRDGVADVAFKLIGKILPDDSPRTVYIKIVAAPSGTTAWVPVQVKG
ncbi:5'-nucleotidase/2',3'-cyclic phosphodiesterase or related esterase [Janibacter sp. HTCC2649]|uniref:bifunctional metallophosphatase/5'-nucleotidase n=1 Tax=Janibacter sp. HTCC2649 TaxID=313589 RepID=UPI0000671A60|nr:bifunctional UDP-sugar hydrolase/5'-nucleotidase [Janibacter sp. HTCC2649]EAP98439.1 5'-nucleotidase/2',3'-cyclic phosphodiesterase or related esterase [Janibacter sp. HTCC2649]